MSADVHRMMEREAEEINSTMICNRKAYADLVSTLHKGNSAIALNISKLYTRHTDVYRTNIYLYKFVNFDKMLKCWRRTVTSFVAF